MATYLGKYMPKCLPPESAIGIFERIDGSWFAHVWREDFGPVKSRQAAERLLETRLSRMPTPVVVSCSPVWLTALAFEVLAACIVILLFLL